MDIGTIGSKEGLLGIATSGETVIQGGGSAGGCSGHNNTTSRLAANLYLLRHPITHELLFDLQSYHTLIEVGNIITITITAHLLFLFLFWL